MHFYGNLFLAFCEPATIPYRKEFGRIARHSALTHCSARFFFMRPGRLLSLTLVLATTVTPCVAKSRKHHSSAKHTKVAAKAKGQRTIDDARATEIQQALVRSGYMTEVSGHWDSTTEAAMQKYQSDNGWQTKLMPDSRAIIKLGLGPNQTNSNIGADTTSSAPQTVAESHSQVGDLSQR
jgi:hypothetical protein